MARLKQKNQKSFRQVVPEDELECVWATAGVISYKLCPYECQCEVCPFDQVMKGLSFETTPYEGEDTSGDEGDSSSQLDDLLMSWVKEENGNVGPTLPDGGVFKENRNKEDLRKQILNQLTSDQIKQLHRIFCKK